MVMWVWIIALVYGASCACGFGFVQHIHHPNTHTYTYTHTNHARHSVCMTKGFGTPKGFKYTGKIKPGRQSPTRAVPPEIMRPDYALDGKPKHLKLPFAGIGVKSAEEIEAMKVAGRLAREVLDEAGRILAPGITTDEIDRVAHEATVARGCYPSPLNYHGFPKSCCTSVNEVVCHGIPDSLKLKEGDIINIDITVYHNGFHGDCSETFVVGDASDEVKQLVKVTHDAWQAGIAFCAPGKKYHDIGAVIEDYITPYGYTSVRNYAGHGIGRIFHEAPSILHYRNNENQGIMQPGHIFTIEPMINLGDIKTITWPDAWTVTTVDGKPSAQFEHTLLMTEDGAVPLTARLPTSNKFWWEA